MNSHRKVRLSVSSRYIQQQELDIVTRSRFKPGEIVILCEQKDSPIALESWDTQVLECCPFCGESIREIQVDENKVEDLIIDSPLNQPYLYILNGSEPGRHITIPGSVFYIGRGSNNDLRIIERTVSRRHARLIFGGERWYLQDLRSINGTLLNDGLTSATNIQSGDTIEIGNIKMMFIV